MHTITIIGSYNQGIVFRANRIPNVGEMVQGFGCFSGSGGKGANQMIAAYKQGAQIIPIRNG